MTALKPCGTLAAYARHRSHGERVDAACRAASRNASRDLRTTERARKQEARLAATVSEVRAQAKPFAIPACARCKRWLCDAAGEPRWDVQGVGTVELVCLGGCWAVDRG